MPDAPLAYRSAGPDGHPLLLLHGIGGSGEDFAPRFEALARRGIHAVAPDLPGHGRSPKSGVEADYALDAQADDVLALVGSLGWPSFAILGHETGGALAQEISVVAHDRVSALILQSTASGPLPVDRNLAEGGIELVRGTGSMEPLVDVYRSLHDGPLSTPSEQQDAVLDRMLQTDPAAYASTLTQVLHGPDRSLLLADLDIPTLVLAGQDDGAFVESGTHLAEVLPDARLATLPACGHRPHVEAPDEWLALVVGFTSAASRPLHRAGASA